LHIAAAIESLQRESRVKKSNRNSRLQSERCRRIGLQVLYSRCQLKKALLVGSGKHSGKWSSVRSNAKRLMDDALMHHEQSIEILENRERWTQPLPLEDIPTDLQLKVASKDMDPRLRTNGETVWSSAMSLKLHQKVPRVDSRVAVGMARKGHVLQHGDTVYIVSEKNYSLAMLLEYDIHRIDDGRLIVKAHFPMTPLSSIDFFGLIYGLVQDGDVPRQLSIVKVSLRWTFSDAHRLHRIVVGQSAEFDLPKEIATQPRPARPQRPRRPPGGGHDPVEEGGDAEAAEGDAGPGPADADDAPPDAAADELAAEAAASDSELLTDEFLDALADALVGRKHGLGSDEGEDKSAAWAAEDAKASGEAVVNRRDRAVVAKAAQKGRISVAKVAARAEASSSSDGHLVPDESFAEAALHEALEIGGPEGGEEDEPPAHDLSGPSPEKAYLSL
jgi:hypothetical protein